MIELRNGFKKMKPRELTISGKLRLILRLFKSLQHVQLGAYLGQWYTQLGLWQNDSLSAQELTSYRTVQTKLAQLLRQWRPSIDKMQSQEQLDAMVNALIEIHDTCQIFRPALLRTDCDTYGMSTMEVLFRPLFIWFE